MSCFKQKDSKFHKLQIQLICKFKKKDILSVFYQDVRFSDSYPLIVAMALEKKSSNICVEQSNSFCFVLFSGH